MALGWMWKYIGRFGGDPHKITVMGESAGGGSIEHQITAFGGNYGPAPFRQAILQSPGFVPIPDAEQQEQALQQFLGILGVDNIDEARKLPSHNLIQGNAYQIGLYSPYGSAIYGPVVDGSFVPELPGKLLLKGNLFKEINVMVGHNSNEGLRYTTPASAIPGGYRKYINQIFPEIQPNVTDTILHGLYPPIYDGTYEYSDPIGRASLATGDVAFQCNTDYLNRAFGNCTYAYLFSVPPGLHGQDVRYTFYNGGASKDINGKDINATVALKLQDYITSFTLTGEPTSPGGPEFPIHGSDAWILNLGNKGFEVKRDLAANPRCAWWQKRLYYQPEH